MSKTCKFRPCENRSRKFEDRYCSIFCADCDDGVISLHEWLIFCKRMREGV